MNTKSKRIIRMQLLQKGVKSELIDMLFLKEYSKEGVEDAEIAAIRKAITKKTKAPDTLTFQEKQKLMASLYRKGFDISKINQVLS